MNDYDTDQSGDDARSLQAYELAGVLIAASFIDVEIAGDFTLDSAVADYNFSSPSQAVTSLTVAYVGSLAKTLYQNDAPDFSDVSSLDSDVMGQLQTSAIALADPHRPAARAQATKMLANIGIQQRIRSLADDLMTGQPIDMTHQSLQYSLPAKMAARRTSQRGIATVMTTNLAGQPL